MEGGSWYVEMETGNEAKQKRAITMGRSHSKKAPGALNPNPTNHHTTVVATVLRTAPCYESWNLPGAHPTSTTTMTPIHRLTRQLMKGAKSTAEPEADEPDLHRLVRTWELIVERTNRSPRTAYHLPNISTGHGAPTTLQCKKSHSTIVISCKAIGNVHATRCNI
jgi:hypothetical protein